MFPFAFQLSLKITPSEQGFLSCDRFISWWDLNKAVPSPEDSYPLLFKLRTPRCSHWPRCSHRHTIMTLEFIVGLKKNDAETSHAPKSQTEDHVCQGEKNSHLAPNKYFINTLLQSLIIFNSQSIVDTATMQIYVWLGDFTLFRGECLISTFTSSFASKKTATANDSDYSFMLSFPNCSLPQFFPFCPSLEWSWQKGISNLWVNKHKHFSLSGRQRTPKCSVLRRCDFVKFPGLSHQTFFTRKEARMWRGVANGRLISNILRLWQDPTIDNSNWFSVVKAEIYFL